MADLRSAYRNYYGNEDDAPDEYAGRYSNLDTAVNMGYEVPAQESRATTPDPSLSTYSPNQGAPQADFTTLTPYNASGGGAANSPANYPIETPAGFGQPQPSGFRFPNLANAKIGGTGGTGGGGTATISKNVATMPLPQLNLPAYDKSQAKAYARKLFAPLMRRADAAIQRVIEQYYENPAAKRQALRAALEGYSIGMGEAQAKSETQGRQEYGQEYAMQTSSAQAVYAAAMSAYLNSMEKVTTQIPVNATTDYGPTKNLLTYGLPSGESLAIG